MKEILKRLHSDCFGKEQFQRIRLVGSWPAVFRTQKVIAANVGVGMHSGGLVTRQADEIISTRYLLGALGSDESHVAICGAGDRPLGVITDEAEAAEDLISVSLFGAADATMLMVAAGAIAAGSLVYTAADGKVQERPSASTEAYCVGRALTASSGDEAVIEVDPMTPTMYPNSSYTLDRTAETNFTLSATVVKQGTAVGQANLCGEADRPLGIVRGTATLSSAVSVNTLNGALETVVANDAIGIGDGVYTAATGKVQGTPTASGSYYCIGTALSAAAADGDSITVLTQPPAIYVIPA